VVRQWRDLLGVPSGRRSAGTSLAGGGFPCGELGGRWAAHCSGGPGRRYSLWRRPAARLLRQRCGRRWTVGCGGLQRLAVKRVVEKAEVGSADLRGRCLLGGDMGGGGLLLGVGVGGLPFPD
jgi:hypothetical protein